MRVFLSGTVGLTLVVIAGLLAGIGLWYAGQFLLNDVQPVAQTAVNTTTVTNQDSEVSFNELDLLYAVKEGTTVTVFRREGFDGNNTELFSYNERVEADTSGNLWAGLPPSIALSNGGESVAYVTGDAVVVRNFETGETRNIISKVAEPLPDDVLERPTWSVDSGSGAYGFGVPRWSSDDLSIGLLTVDWEGSTLVTRAVNGDGFAAQGAVGGNVYYHWSPIGNRFVLPTYGAYARPGLYVGSGVDELAVNILQGSEVAESDFLSAEFSPQGDRIVFVYQPYNLGTNVQKIGTVAPDGTDLELFSYTAVLSSPFFGPTSNEMYFVRNTSEGIYKLQMHNRKTGELSDAMQLPSGYNQWYYLGWIDGDVLMQGTVAHVGVEAGDSTQLYLLDPDTGAVVNTSGQFDQFVTFMGLAK
ncbi:MAG: hypothetical protein A2898_03065 [Candidatus Kerfeldbacteria bacterium RIFCSPLOWO2_01_FULL_48_11]|uniref:DUF5050 domain-containing protein n=1 Tax=Candidatus Kerfeldbacteria bacterium RIFCSPLOWO2_01_FULL_48_11 TaxID=1798543 RepID=A0A1G2B519_9BACT|nr:MAG: hypothetical protein A2898_03065 [Candidatus Kerfeldbacteria bacterium RIFCSPLOWO2_01_FULL_48_11]